jgi:hypothetical protein
LFRNVSHNIALPRELQREDRLLQHRQQGRSGETESTLNPKHPERVCWGCDKYCSADDLRCGNGTIRTQHPVELFGEDWIEWELDNRPAEPQDLAHEK